MHRRGFFQRMSGGMCGWITSTKIINGLYFLLSFFHLIFRDWGLAIICLVFIVRACLHPITKKSQINMAKMSKMGPEIALGVAAVFALLASLALARLRLPQR